MIRKRILLTNLKDDELYFQLLKVRKYTILSKEILLPLCNYTIKDLDNPSKSFIFSSFFQEEFSKAVYSKNVKEIVYVVDDWSLDVFEMFYEIINTHNFHSYDILLATYRNEEVNVLRFIADYPLTFDICLFPDTNK